VKSVGKGYAPAKRHGVDVRLVTDDGHDLAAYFAKNVYAVKSSASAAADVTSSHTKTARQGNVTPFGILARLVANGEARDLALWHEWEAASKGKRQLLWSNGLRADLGIGVEVARMPPRDYRRLAFAGLLPAVLDAAEAQDGGHRLYSLLSGHGIPWEAPLARAGG